MAKVSYLRGVDCPQGQFPKGLAGVATGMRECSHIDLVVPMSVRLWGYGITPSMFCQVCDFGRFLYLLASYPQRMLGVLRLESQVVLPAFSFFLEMSEAIGQSSSCWDFYMA